MNVAILQPFYPHYRFCFFKFIEEKVNNLDLYSYEKLSNNNNGFNIKKGKEIHLKSFQYKGILIYNIFSLLFSKYDTIVLMLNFAHLSTWLILLTKFIHRKNIILWGQGISVKRYLKEETKPDWKLKLMIALSDGVWLYMDKERDQWHKLFPNKKIVALNNTISDIGVILNNKYEFSKDTLKDKYNIKEEILLIFCARFTNPYRRIDILEKTIQNLDPSKYGFIIIGEGNLKPDFSKYNNVYDFGAVYNNDLKKELFYIADIYFQPGWVGLSIVEAMAYGKPIFTMKRSNETKQCVEYSYIKDNFNGRIFASEIECWNAIEKVSSAEIKRLSANALKTATPLTISNMANNALSIL